MAAFMIDIDGTTTYFGTNTFLPNAKETILKWLKNGDQIIFTTRRPNQGNDEILSVFDNAFGKGNYSIIFSVDSPRIVLNDDGAHAINHPRDAAWNYPT